MVKNYYSVKSEPSAFITKNKQRVRQYGSTVYLKNGDEFEIELQNPTQSVVLAKIKLNGEYISHSGIILKPGQRIFLERYFDKPNKFKFETYEIEDNYTTKNAIALNGFLVVEFYNENVSQQYYPLWYSNNNYFNYDTTTAGPEWVTTTNINYNACRATSYSTSNTAYSTSNTAYSTSNNACIETGRVESGSYSNQTFVGENREFNNFYTYKSEWKILPESQKPYDSKDLKVYCTECGTRVKNSSHKFCYNCGTPLK